MFCYQCQETAKNTGCTKVGVCGKCEHLSKELDDLIFECQELAALNHQLRQYQKDDLQASRMITDALFTSITNTNFDIEVVVSKIKLIREKKQELKTRAHENHIPLHNLKLTFLPPILGQSSILEEQDQDLRSLKQLIIYGLKGVSAYARHAQRLGYEDNTLYSNLEEALSLTRQKETTKDQLISCVKGVGELGIRAMHLLDKANTITFGHPQNTKVATTVGNRPGILVTGHDLQDLKELLDQTHDKQIDVYTHGEMLPAHYYPYFKKYPHFKGNYGGSWWQQTKEFEKFNGPILFTSNCIVPPPANATYQDRLYTTGSAYLENAKHIPLNHDTQTKKFTCIINKAHQCKPPQPIDNTELQGGFAHQQLTKLKPQIISAIKKGDIKKFVVMAGCDGRMPVREYYTNFAKALPSDTIILTAGCAKYRYNKLSLQPNPHFPRVLDAGQCNDTYSLIVFADELRKELGLKNLNDLPIVYNIAWYEQKAVIVLLAMLSLGIKNIKLGPTLPAFLSPNIIHLLQNEYHLSTITTIEDDMRHLAIK